MRVFVIAGSPIAQPPCGYAPGPADRVIAADYGAHHARAWGWPIDLLIGDLDSLPAAELQAARAAGVPTVTAPAAKDETDLELAVARALGDGATELVICGALGGRADHMLANVLLLARRELIGVEAVIADGAQTLRVLRGDDRATRRAASMPGAGRRAGRSADAAATGGRRRGRQHGGAALSAGRRDPVLRAGARGQQRVRGRDRTHLAAARPAARDPYPNSGGLR